MKVIIIGGVAGGATAISRLRRLDENAEIVLFERGAYVSFANCGLPYYVGGVIQERDALFVATEESIEGKYHVDIRTQSNVVGINRDTKTVVVEDLTTGKNYEESYDKLLISTGSSPLRPPIPGIDGAGIFTLWNIPDVDAIKAYVEEKKPRSAVVVGGGFIGLEMAENLVEAGIHVDVVEMADQVMAPLDKDFAQVVHSHLVEKGVRVHLKDGVCSFEDVNGKKRVTLSSGEIIDSDMVMLSIGVRPNSELAKMADLACNSRGGVIVDAHMQTSDPDIYAVGDVIETDAYVLSERTMVPLAGPANKQGRIAADNLAGVQVAYTGVMGTSVAKIFDLTVAVVGLNEKALQRMGRVYGKDYLFSVVHPNHHAGYYPGAQGMSIKLLFDMEGLVLGAQIIGYAGVDKRIDVIATLLHFRGQVQDLIELELAYAPPYSSAKDPVNMAGYVAENMLKGIMHGVLPKDIDDTYTLIDVREADELAVRKLDHALHIPLASLRENLSALDKNKKYLVFCAVGLRGYIGQRILRQHGFDAYDMIGGLAYYDTWFYELPDSWPEREMLSKTAATSEVPPQADNVLLLDACGLSCPGPIVKTANQVRNLQPGEVVEVRATDPGFANDIKAWCNSTGNRLLETGKRDDHTYAIIKKQGEIKSTKDVTVVDTPTGKNIIVFSGDLDKAIAAFIIANGARAMGDEVQMFFTFWGLTMLKKHRRVATAKDPVSRMFGKMMPKNSRHLGLSKMNLFGIGPKMIRSVMKGKRIDSLESLIKQAQEAGVVLTACQMSMDVMGIEKEELFEGVEIAGVAAMLNFADRSNMSLFI